MSDVTEPVDTDEGAKAEEQTVPYERFKQANAQAKEAKAAAKAASDQVAALQRQLEERESAGLPELERERKAREQIERRLQEAEQRAEEAERRVQRSQRERWVAAAAKDFTDSSDAVLNVNLDEIETEADAERAVKRVAKAKPHLLKADEPRLPGRVLANGRPAIDQSANPAEQQRQEEANMIFEGIKNLTRNWQPGGSL